MSFVSSPAHKELNLLIIPAFCLLKHIEYRLSPWSNTTVFAKALCLRNVLEMEGKVLN